jgi:hypothetical protein
MSVATAPRVARGKAIAVRRRRLIACAASLALHLVLLAALFSATASPRLKAIPEPPSLTVALVSGLTLEPAALPAPRPTARSALAPPPPSAPPRPTPPEAAASVNVAAPILADAPISSVSITPVSLTAAPVSLPGPSVQVQASDPARAGARSGGADCDLTGPLQARLQADAEVMSELSRIPRQARSVANAIMLWDGRWAPIEARGAAALADPLHQAIIAAVRTLSPTCLAQPVLGPRLLTLTDPQGATVLALGSGGWSWGQLLAPAPPGG